MKILKSKKFKNRMAEIGIVALYFFGSRAEGVYDEKSDCDLGLLFRPEVSRRLSLSGLMDIREEIAQYLLPIEPDIVDLEKAPIQLRFKIISKGKLIFSFDEEIRLNFEDRTIRDYLDFRPFIKKYYEDFKISITEGYGR